MNPSKGLSRREALQLFSAALASGLAGSTNAEAAWQAQRTGLGLVLYCCSIRRQQQQAAGGADLFQPQHFLEHCRQLGAGGMQAGLGIADASVARSLRHQAEHHQMYIEAIVSPPRDRADVERFSAEMETAARAGALAARTVILPGRRYEYFDSLDQFRDLAAAGRDMLELAAPVAEKFKVPLAVENHKDQRNDERVALFEQISSEYVGACVDTGNSVALLEDPIATVEMLAPWAFSVHLKDQAVQEYEEGFLLGDIPLGQGYLDLKKMVQILRDKKPDIRFTLELITRDPLKVPCLTPKYWVTMPTVPAQNLARTLRSVRAGAAKHLQQVSDLSEEKQVALEDANVAASLEYARRQLNI